MIFFISRFVLYAIFRRFNFKFYFSLGFRIFETYAKSWGSDGGCLGVGVDCFEG
jgi:hypothetical protein